jgi:hypothetical protein
MIVTSYQDPTAIDPRPAPLDDELRRLCATFRARPAGIRNALTTDDFYTLLAFARRAAVFAIRERDAAWIEDGLTAVAMIDDERIERDALAPELGLLHHAAERIGAGDRFAEAAARATRSAARLFRAPVYAGWEEIATGFVRRDANDYHPRQDLLRIALAIRAVRPGVRVVAVEPENAAVLSGRQPRAHRIPGIGVGFVPAVLNRALIDEVIPVDDDDAIETARELAPRRLGAANEHFDAREPDDAEMVGWLERRDDYLLLETA